MVAVTSLRPDRCVVSERIFQSDLSGLSIGKQVQTGLIRIYPCRTSFLSLPWLREWCGESE